MLKTILIILLLLNVSCANKRLIQKDSKAISNDNLKDGVYTSPKGDYLIDFGEKWKLTYQDSPDSSNIVVSTHIIDLDSIQMLRIYRFDDNETSLELKMDQEISKKRKFYNQITISAVSKINFLEKEALMIEYEYHNTSDNIERSFVMEAENGNYYVLEILVSKTLNYIENLKELEALIKTFKTK